MRRVHHLACALLLLAGPACVDLTPPDHVPLVDHMDGGPQADRDGPADMGSEGTGEIDAPVEASPDAPVETASEPPPLDLSAGLIGYWKLDALNTNTTPDSSLNNNFATILGGPTVLTTMNQLPSAIKFNDPGAFQFAQIDTGLTAPNTAQLPTRLITVAAWVKFSNLTSTRRVCGGLDARMQYILHHRNGRAIGNNLLEGVALIKQVDGTFAFILTPRSGARTTVVSTTAVTGTGRWFHVAGTYDGSQMKIYVNGNAEGMQPYNSDIDYTTTRPWVFARTSECGGTNEDNYDVGLDGYLDDVRIYDRALDSGEVFALGASGLN